MLMRLAVTLLAFAACDAGDMQTPVDASHADDAPADAAIDARPLGGGFAYTISIVDPQNALTAAHSDIIACAKGGLDEWGTYLSGMGTLVVELRVMPTMVGRFAAASTSNLAVGPCKNTPSCTLVEEQAIHRLRTGAANPAMPNASDLHVDIDPMYWNSQVWVDPDPSARTAMVPNNRLDCVSLFTHELGHAFGMTGFRSLTTFQPTGAFQTLWDDLIVVGSGTLTFNGAMTVAEYGGPLPLTRTNTTQNVYHYGDPSGPAALEPLLMNGVVYNYGYRYRVSPLDLTIMADLGITIRGMSDRVSDPAASVAP